MKKKRGRPKIKRPVGRPRKKLPVIPQKKAVAPARDKSAKIKKKMERFLLDMFSIYEDKQGKESIKEALIKNNKFSESFIKEFFGLVRKYFDLKVAEMKIVDNNGEPEKYHGPQNVFIIAGLHDRRLEKVVQDAVEGKPVREAEFNVVGLDVHG